MRESFDEYEMITGLADLHHHVDIEDGGIGAGIEAEDDTMVEEEVGPGHHTVAQNVTEVRALDVIQMTTCLFLDVLRGMFQTYR